MDSSHLLDFRSMIGVDARRTAALVTNHRKRANADE